VIVAFLGFLDATYLTVKEYSGENLNCVIFDGCNEVANSEYRLILGLPVALYGVIYYFGILFIGLLYLDDPSRKFPNIFKLLSVKFLPIYTLIGFVMTLRFVYLQLFVIKAICSYCMMSAVTSTLLFFFGMTLLKNKFYKESI